MDAPDFRALVDSLTDVAATDLADVFANFSTDMLQQANALLAATATTTSRTAAIVGDGGGVGGVGDGMDGFSAVTSDTDIIHLEDIEVAAALALSNSDTLVNRTLQMQCLRQKQQDEGVSKRISLTQICHACINNSALSK